MEQIWKNISSQNNLPNMQVAFSIGLGFGYIGINLNALLFSAMLIALLILLHVLVLVWSPAFREFE